MDIYDAKKEFENKMMKLIGKRNGFNIEDMSLALALHRGDVFDYGDLEGMDNVLQIFLCGDFYLLQKDGNDQVVWTLGKDLSNQTDETLRFFIESLGIGKHCPYCEWYIDPETKECNCYESKER